MTAIVFSTNSLIDIRAFTTMGLSAKPNTNSPIGYFGTGLKYAMAVLVRLGAEPIVWIGKDKYTFQKERTEFRGKSFDLLKMKVDKFKWLKSRYTELPFTTEYGRNWEMWMAFRELESNTRDENGTTYPEDMDTLQDFKGLEGYTHIIVDHPDFLECYNKLGETFLEGALRGPREDGSQVQIFPGESKHIYWRGLKVCTPFHPTLNTYNFLGHLDLTEDRTLGYEFYAKQMLANDLVKSNDEKLIKEILTCDERHWEHNMDMPYYEKPSQTFRQVMFSNPQRMNTKASEYYYHHEPKAIVEHEEPEDRVDYPAPWHLDTTRILDADSQTVFECSAINMIQGIPRRKWTKIAEHVINLVNKDIEDA